MHSAASPSGRRCGIEAQCGLRVLAAMATRVLTASTDRTVQVWEASTGEPVGRPLYHHGAVLDAHFSLDGRHIVTASDVTAQVWSAPVRLPISSRIGSNDAVEVASFIGDERVASIGRDGTVRLWDASSTGQPLNEAVRLQQWHGVWGVVRLSPDGRRVAAIWRQESWHQGTAQIWDTISGRELFHWEGADDIGFSNDGRRLVMVLEKTARIVDSTTGRPIGELLRHTDDIRWAAFSADGETIVTGADAIARLWDTSTGKPVGKPFEHDGEVHLASLSPDGRSMVTISISNRGEARLWNRMTGQAVGMPLSDEASVRTASFSSDGGRIITTSDDGTVRLWNATTAEPIGEGFKHEASVIVAGFSPDGNRVVTGCRDGTVRVWDPQMGLTLGAPISHEGLRRLQMSPSGRRLLTLSSDGTVRTWDLPIGTADKADAELLAQSATMLSGLRVTDGGALVRATDQGEGLRKLRQRVLRAMPMQSSAESLIRWLFEHPWERTISPFSKTTAEVHTSQFGC